MTQTTRPTRRQKELLKARNLCPLNWLVLRDTPDYLLVVHRHGTSQRRIDKRKGAKD